MEPKDSASRALQERIGAMALDCLDPSDTRHHVDDSIGHVFARLRREAPVHRTRSPVAGIGEYWSVTRYHDIVQVETQPGLYSSDWRHGGITLMDFPPGEQQLRMFIAMDPPEHGAARAAVHPMVAPASLAKWEPLIRQRTAQVLDGLPHGEPFDWVDRVSVELSTMMLATLFDFPQEERRSLARWSDMATANQSTNPDAPDPATRMAELRAMLERFMHLWKERLRAPPRQDLLSMLAHDPATRAMDPQELMGNLVLLVVGGSDTTRNTMSGGVLALHDNPAEMARLRARPTLVESLVPEIIRWQTPLAYMRRTATQDSMLGGQQIRQGDKLALWYLSGNRDEQAISEAGRFIIDRARPRQHLSFGFGIHHCVGSRLAELQLRVLWEELLQRFATIELVGQPERVRSFLVHGFTRMMVRVHR